MGVAYMNVALMGVVYMYATLMGVAYVHVTMMGLFPVLICILVSSSMVSTIALWLELLPFPSQQVIWN